MIIFLEATNMIIKRLEIKNLHGIYNYNVSFNDDLTFIFGENGCGKTTILDIVSSIVTGRLYNLFSYDFSQEIGSTDTHIEQIRERIHTQFNGNEDDKVLSVICGKYQFESLCRQLRGCCRKNINREIFRTVLISNFDIQHLSFLKDKILQLMADNLLESNSA